MSLQLGAHWNFQPSTWSAKSTFIAKSAQNGGFFFNHEKINYKLFAPSFHPKNHFLIYIGALFWPTVNLNPLISPFMSFLVISKNQPRQFSGPTPRFLGVDNWNRSDFGTTTLHFGVVLWLKCFSVITVEKIWNMLKFLELKGNSILCYCRFCAFSEIFKIFWQLYASLMHVAIESGLQLWN